MASALGSLSCTVPQREVCLVASWQGALSPTKEISERLACQASLMVLYPVDAISHTPDPCTGRQHLWRQNDAVCSAYH